MKTSVSENTARWARIFGVRWEPKRLLFVYGLFILVLPWVALWIDQPLINLVKEGMTPTVSSVSEYLTLVGDAAQYIGLSLIALIGLYFVPQSVLSGRIADLKSARRKTLFFFMSFIISGILVHIGKFLFGRQRPYHSDTLEALVFEPLNIDYHFHSFPSGHSQTIFTMMAILSLIKPRYNVLFLVIGIVVAFTRITLYNHFFSDILAGGLIGITGTVLSYRFIYKRASEADRPE